MRFFSNLSGAPSFMRSARWLAGVAVMARGTTLAATVGLSRLLQPPEFGEVALVQTAVVLFTGVAALGLTVSVAREVARTRAAGREAAGRVLGTAFLAGGLAALAIGALYVGALRIYSTQLADTGPELPLTIFAGIGITFSALSAVLQAGLLGIERFGSYAAAQAIQAVATSAGLVLGAAVGDSAGAVAGLAGGFAATTAATAFLIRRSAREEEIPLPMAFSSAAWRELWGLGKVALVGTLLVSGALFGGQLVLSAQDNGLAEVAAFNVAYRWHLAILLIPASIAPILVPMMARLLAEQRSNETAKLFSFNLLLHTLVSAGLATVVVAAAPLILRLHGPFYADDSFPLILMALAAVPSAINNVLSSASLSYGLIRAWLLSDCILAACLVIAASLLTPSSGATGLAAAYAIAFLATDLSLVVPIRVRMQLPVGDSG